MIKVVSKKYQVLAIVGQTATGKSDLAVSLAPKLKGEIISADSRQVYKELNLGAGKITKEEMCEIPHHLLDVCDLTHTYSVAEFASQAHEITNKLLSKNVTPIICGGTGQYIDAALTNISFPRTPANTTLRQSLEKLSTHDLFERLQKADPRRAEKIDHHNRVRLIRALEIVEELGSVPLAQIPDDTHNTLRIGLYAPIDVLRERIAIRLRKRIDAGMIDEVRAIISNGIPVRKLHDLGLEYRYTADLIAGHLRDEEYFKILSTKIGQFAKRQMTWFKRNKDIVWHDISKHSKEEIMKNVLSLWEY